MSHELKRYEILSSLGEEERSQLADLLEPIDLEAGEPLFKERQESEGLVLVERGMLRLESERGALAGKLGPGGDLGGLSLIALGHREVTAVASEPTRVLVLTRSAFLRFADDVPRAGCRLLEAILADTAAQLRQQLDRLAPAETPGS